MEENSGVYSRGQALSEGRLNRDPVHSISESDQLGRLIKSDIETTRISEEHVSGLSRALGGVSFVGFQDLDSGFVTSPNYVTAFVTL